MSAPPQFGKKSFTLENPGGHPAIVFHGLTATPDEVDALATLMHKLGFTVHVPLLPGHGTSIRELSKVSTADFLRAAENAFEEVTKTSSEEVLLVGTSFGTLLALYLAAKFHRKVKGCVLLALPWKLRSQKNEALLKTFSLLPEWVLSLLPSVKKPSRPHVHFTNPVVRYDFHSLGAASRLFKIQRVITPLIPEITCRIFILEDPSDHHLAENAAGSFQEQFEGRKIELEFVPGAEHEMLIGPKATTVEARVVHFIDSLYHLKKW